MRSDISHCLASIISRVENRPDSAGNNDCKIFRAFKTTLNFLNLPKMSAVTLRIYEMLMAKLLCCCKIKECLMRFTTQVLNMLLF